MCSKLSSNSLLKHIGVISLSNIGDVVLTAPVLDVLLRDFPTAKISVVVGPKAESLFAGHPRLETIVFDKQMRGNALMRWCWQLYQRGFDCLVDLRQSAFGLFLPCRFKTPLWPRPFVGHMRHKHLSRLAAIYPDFVLPKAEGLAIIPTTVAVLNNLRPYVVIAPGAADERKRWSKEKFAALALQLINNGEFLVFVGDWQDAVIVDEITAGLNATQYLSLAGHTDLRALAGVLRGAKYAIVHDSGTMHLGSYLNIPLVAIWGPTDFDKYGPWSTHAVVVKNPQGISAIHVEDVLNATSSLT